MNSTNKLPTLQINIENNEDVELFDFVSSMSALNDEYIRFVTQNKKQKPINDFKLYVNKVSDGSIIIDLVEKTLEILPGMVPLIVEFSCFLVDTLDYLSGRKDNLPLYYSFRRENFINYKKIVSIAANNHKNSLNILGINLNKTIVVNHHYSSVDSNAIQNQSNREIKRLEEKGESLLREKVNLKLYQARDSILSESTRGNLGIIEEISDKPKPLEFVNDRLRYDISKAEKNPLNFIYNVDIEIKLKEGSLCLQSHKDIKEYEILKLHGLIENIDLFSEK